MTVKYTIHEIEAMLKKCRDMGREPKLEVSFISRYDYYFIRWGEKLSLQRYGKEDDRSIVFYYDNFYDLAHDGSLDELLLEAEWDDIDYMSCNDFDILNMWNDVWREVDFEGEDFADMPVKNQLYKGVNTLGDLFTVFIKSVRRNTAFPGVSDQWREDDPTRGQCVLGALLVNDAFGGTIHRVIVNGEPHCFNIVDGRIIDFGCDQYYEMFVPVKYEDYVEVDRSALEADEGTANRYAMLKQNIADFIEITR